MEKQPKWLPTLLPLLKDGLGALEPWEEQCFDMHDRPFVCQLIAGRQTSPSRARMWLNLTEKVFGNVRGDSVFMESALMYAMEGDCEHKADEVAVKLTLAEGADDLSVPFVEYANRYDPECCRFRRWVVQTLLSGSLEKNKESSSLYTSFFHSSLREVHLLPFIATFLVGHKDTMSIDPATHRPKVAQIHSLLDISRLLLFDAPLGESLKLYPKYERHLVGFLPLLFSRLPSLKRFSVRIPSMKRIQVDLSFLNDVGVDVSGLLDLTLSDAVVSSLSPLSSCDLSSLERLTLFSVRRLKSLEGLTDRNTARLRSLSVSSTEVVDISALAGCALSSLEVLNLGGCAYLSDISPLRNSTLSSLSEVYLDSVLVADLSPLCIHNLSSLTVLDLRSSAISDLSPLGNCSLSSLVDMNLQNTDVASLAPLSRCDLSSLSNLNISYTSVSDLSPLSQCPSLSNLKHLVADEAPISDLAALSEWKQFAPCELSFYKCASLTDISPLARVDMTNLSG